MQSKKLLVTIILLCGLSCDFSSFAQEFDETLPPLVSEEYSLEGETTAETETALWTPAFLNGSSSALTNSLRKGHIYSAVDFAMLSASDEAFPFDGDAVLTPRFQLGWESESGFGMRGSYWEFDQNLRDSIVDSGTSLTDVETNDFFDFIHVNSNNIVNFPIAGNEPVPLETHLLGRDIQSVELELYQRVIAGESKVMFGTGIRSVRSSRQFDYVYSTIEFGGGTLYSGDIAREIIDGMGITLVSEFNHPLFTHDTTELGFVLSGRTSYIPAEFEVKSEFINHTFDDELWINEGNVGLELLSRRRHVTLRLRGLFETQYWNSSVTDNQALTGTSLSFGVDW